MDNQFKQLILSYCPTITLSACYEKITPYRSIKEWSEQKKDDYNTISNPIE
jgi:hypothetical protein